MIHGVVRIEGHREQTALASARDQRADVEERRRPDTAALEHDDPSGLLDDVEAARLAEHSRRVNRCIGLHNAHEVQRCDARTSRAGESRRGEHEKYEEPSHGW